MEDTPSAAAFILVQFGSQDAGVVTALQGQLAGTDQSVGAQAAPDPDVDAMVTSAAAVANSTGAAGVLWLDRQRDGLIVVYLYDAASGETYKRDVESTGTAAAANEAIALAARRAISTLQEGFPAGMRPLDRPPSEPAVPPSPESAPASAPPPTRPRHRGRVEATYVGSNYSDEHPWVSGGAVWVGWLAPIGVHVAVGYHAMGPARAATSLVSLEIQRHPIELVVGYRWVPRKLGVEVELAGIVDVVTLDATSSQEAVSTPDRPFVDPGAGARARLDYAPLSWLSLVLGVGLDVFPSSVPLVSRAPETDVIVTPKIARVRAEAGLSFRF